MLGYERTKKYPLYDQLHWYDCNFEQNLNECVDEDSQ